MELGIDFWRFELLIFWNLNSPMSLAGWTLSKKKHPVFYALHSYIHTTKVLLLHFVAFFHVASLLSTGVENKKVGVDNEKALELTNSPVFHRGRQ